jgi:dTMP kinase
MIQSKGKLIVFEGGDGAGKTTQATLLHSRIPNSCLFKYPNRSTSTGRILNAYLTGEVKLTNQTINLIFLANFWEIIDDINKCLEEGKTVIMDRYIVSHFVYSICLREGDLEQIKILAQGSPKPDVTFYLTKNEFLLDKKTEIYDKREIQTKILQEFDSFPFKKDQNWISIDCTDLSIEQVHQKILQRIHEINI